jgi:hypothetical protein
MNTRREQLLSTQPPAPSGENGPLAEQKAEHGEETRSPAQRLFEKLLLGTDTAPGILKKLEQAQNPAEIKDLKRAITDLPFDAEALLIFGHRDAIEAGVHAYQSAKMAYEAHFTKALVSPNQTGVARDQSDAAHRALMTLCRWQTVHPESVESVLTPVLALTTDAYQTLKAKSSGPGLDALMPHRMLKTRLLTAGMEAGLLDSVPAEDKDLFVLEPNDLNDPLMTKWAFGWDGSYLALEGCDANTFSALGERFNAMCEVAQKLHDTRAKTEPQSLDWMKQLVEHQNTWFRLKLDMIGKIGLID